MFPPSLLTRARWKLAALLWPERLRPNKLVTRWRLRACESEAVGRWQAAGAENSGWHRPEDGEDALLWELLRERNGGFFVEAGAYDGYTFSVSYLFEGIGWTGVLVEALADRASECSERRRSSKVVNAVLSHPDAPSTVTFARDATVEWNSAVAAGGERGDVVQTTTLDDVLEGHTDAIDFVVLDLEGHELQALEGFDLDRWKPSLLLVEDNGDDRVQERLRSHGYARVAQLAQNDLFIRGDELALKNRLHPFWADLGPPV